MGNIRVVTVQYISLNAQRKASCSLCEAKKVHVQLTVTKQTARSGEGSRDILSLLMGLKLTECVAGEYQKSLYKISPNIITLLRNMSTILPFVPSASAMSE
jgi:hypothetical protein